MTIILKRHKKLSVSSAYMLKPPCGHKETGYGTDFNFSQYG